MIRVLHHTLPNIPGAGQLHIDRFGHLNTYQHEQLSQPALDPFAAQVATRPIILDKEMLVPATANLYPPAAASIGDIVGRAAAPYFDTIQSSVRRLLHREPPRIYTTLPQEEPLLNPAVVAPRQPFTWQHYAAAGLATTALVTGCSTGSDLADVVIPAIGLNLAGGLALFLYGMKQMSDGVKASSGDTLKKVIGRLAGNRISSMLVGTGVTSVIQSSSVTSVLTLGLVHAGVMNLTQALGVIAGANVGTTMTAWLMSTGFSKYGLALIGGAGLTYLFSKKSRTREISRGIMGLGMVFHGLKVMSTGFKDPEITSRLTDLFSSLNDPSVGGLAVCMAVGAGVTALIQSSSATLGICIALAAKGIIPFEAAVGISLGANIGTTITAWLATPGATVDAKRVAVAHTAFNVGGALLVLPFCPQFAAASKDLALTLGITSPAKQVAFVHTLFNVGAMMLFLPFLGHVKNAIVRLVPDKDTGQVGAVEAWKTRLSERVAKTPGTALLAARKMIYGEMIPRTLSTFEDLAKTLRSGNDPRTITEAVSVREREIDRFWSTGYRFFRKVEAAPLNPENSALLGKLWGIGSEIEKVADCLEKIVSESITIHRSTRKTPSRTITDIHAQVMEHFNLVMDAVTQNRPAVFDEAVVHNDTLKALVEAQQEGLPVFDDPANAKAYDKIMHEYRSLLSHLKNILEFLASKK